MGDSDYGTSGVSSLSKKERGVSKYIDVQTQQHERTGRETYRNVVRRTDDGQAGRESDRLYRDGQTGREADSFTDRQADWQASKQPNRKQAGRNVGRQVGKQVGMLEGR